MSLLRASAGQAFAYGFLVLGGTAVTLPSSTSPVAAPHPFIENHSSPGSPAGGLTPGGMERDDRDRAISEEMPAVALALRPHAAVPPESDNAPADAGRNAEEGFGRVELTAFAPAPHTGTLRYGSDTIQLPFDPATDTYSFGPMRLKHELVENIVHAAYLAGVDPRLLMAIADKESSFVVRARASTSSATGLFQFIDSTWLRAVRDFGPRFGLEDEARAVEFGDGSPSVSDEQERRRILNMRNDPFLSTLFAASMLRREQEKLASRLGRPISDAEVYLVHFLGPAGAQKFLSVLAEKPKTAAANLLPQAARANKPIFYATQKRKTRSLSVAQVHEKIENSLERRLVRYRNLDFGAASIMGAPPASGLPDAALGYTRL